jgi:Abnormal spindle-like microcephaly-assoc'd, ASPM-SPD-2-Hydin
MRRTCTALIALTVLILAVGSTGPSAFGIDPGPLTANPDPLDFGSQDVGDATPAQSVTLTNSNGTVALTITGVGASGDYNVPGGSDHCTGATLNVGDSCNVGVTFQPGSTGADPGTLTINDDDSTDGVTQQSMNLNGNGVSNQFAVSNPSSFGDQSVGTTSSAQSVTVTNNTDYSANPANPTISGSNAGNFNASGCSGSVAGNGTCTVNVTFTPSDTGVRNATLNVAGQSVPLTGTGVQAAATVTPASTTFGSQPVSTSSITKTITLKNSGTGTLTYNNTTVTGANAGDFSVGDSNCASTVFLAANDTCTITVQFVPTATGHRSANIVVHDNAPSNPTQTVTVSGTATASSVGFGPPTAIFATTIPAGTASPGHTITVFNETSASMPITSTVIAGANPKSFIETGDTCSGTTLAANVGKCTVKVKFAPSSAGRRTALLDINDTGPVPPHLHQITLTGNASFPNNPKKVAGSVGCSTAHIRWVAPSATRFAGTIVIRNHAHYPTSIADGTRVPHTAAGLATDRGLKHFTTYYYRVFATYHSLTHTGKLNYSQGLRLKERTGQICTPENGARNVGVTPTVTWLPSPTKGQYAFVLQRGSLAIDVKYTARTQWHFASSWHYNEVARRLVPGHTYTFYLYAYPASHPSGMLIGSSTFTVR